MGLSASSEIFQKIIEEILGDLPGQISISDDLCIFGKDEEEHYKNVVAVLKRLEEHGLTVNKGKCSIGQTEMDFFGFHFSKDGMSVSDTKFKALMEAGTPQNAKELRSLLGLAQYCERAAIPNFAKIVEPLRKLTKKNVPFILTEVHEQALRDFKNAIVKYAMAYFNKDWTTRLVIDASPKGLGMIHTQFNPRDPSQKSIVEFKSRTLTPVESRYHQTELEALALVWAVEKRHYYVYNADFEVVTDNKAVELLYGRASSIQKGRIQRWGLRLLPYRMKIIHQEGANNIADYLSRHPVGRPDSSCDYDTIAERHINMIVIGAIPKALSRRELAQASRLDRRIRNVIQMVRQQKHKKDTLFEKLLPDLTITNDGLLLRLDRIVIPKSLQNAIIEIAHSGHQGIVKTKRLARKHVWFPGMDRKIEKAVKRCVECHLNTKSEKFTPIHSTVLPKGPWRELALDWYGPVWGKYVLILIDYFSRYPIAKILGSTSAKALLPFLDEIFSLFGIPKRLKTDNGPPFNSEDFRKFCLDNDIKHDKVTPYWPRANGLVEAFMKNLTKCLKNSQVSGKPFEKELQEFLRSYRATPHSSTGETPNSLLFRAKPSTTRLPNAFEDDEIAERARRNDKKAKKKQVEYGNAKTKAKMHVFKVGDKVLLRQTSWGKKTVYYDERPFKVTGVSGSMITIERAGKTYARNCSLLKKDNKRAAERTIRAEESEDEHPDPDVENRNINQDMQRVSLEQQGQPDNQILQQRSQDELGTTSDNQSNRRISARKKIRRIFTDVIRWTRSTNRMMSILKRKTQFKIKKKGDVAS